MSRTLCRAEPRTSEADYFLEQANACRAIARLQLHPTHRATFLRLALHWRAVAHSINDLADADAAA